jgi:murein DD-endopeptidase MepM/ murein hydrolase activator NlpD
MTHFLQRSALVLLATSALCATPALARTTHHAKKPAAAEADQATSYTVKKGDTLATIADKLDTTIDELRAANKLKKTSVLHPGQVLKGPAAAKPEGAASSTKGAAPKAAAPKSYKVAHGDTLFSISQREHVSIEDLRKANGLSAKGQIHAGQELRLPGGDEDAAPADKPSAKADAPAKGAKGRKARLSPQEAAEAASTDHAASGRVTTTQSRGESYKAKKGDTLAKIAGRLDTDVGELKRLNHIKGSAVRVGQVYRGPSFAEHLYVAAPGDTLVSIAERFGVSLASLRAENELSKRTVSVRPGQKVYLPDGYHDRNGPAEERPSRIYPPAYQPGLPSRPIPYAPSGAGQTPSVTPNAAPPPSAALISQLGKGRFLWPLQGKILSDFGPKPAGQNNAGIDIQAGAGDPVRAAADGDVVYAGDQVPGFGNLVLIQHADGWATVYAYLSRIDVKNKQKITQGQQVGQAGTSGGVSEPQVHFEVRYAPSPAERAAPIDPKLVLPKN